MKTDNTNAVENAVEIIECFSFKLEAAKQNLKDAKSIIKLLGFKGTCAELDGVIKDLERSIGKATQYVKEHQ